jgi:formate dehydrogenase maturation protein FdhE
LLNVDLLADPAAVPLVDEMSALPLDLYAREKGFAKITPNLMGF